MLFKLVEGKSLSSAKQELLALESVPNCYMFEAIIFVNCLAFEYIIAVLLRFCTPAKATSETLASTAVTTRTIRSSMIVNLWLFNDKGLVRL